MIDYEGHVKKTPKSRDELIKTQSKRLKKLNKEYREMYSELKKTYEEMAHYRHEDKKKARIIKKAIEHIMYPMFSGDKEEVILLDLLNILKGEDE